MRNKRHEWLNLLEKKFIFDMVIVIKNKKSTHKKKTTSTTKTEK